MRRIRRDPYLVPDACVAAPRRTPFTRAGYRDAGFYFFYVTARGQWSVLLDATDPGAATDSADREVESGRTQLWVMEKVYSTRRARRRERSAAEPEFSLVAYNDIPRLDWSGRLLVVLREPYPFPTRRGDQLGYYADRTAAIAAADAYTTWKNRRAVVGLMRADIGKY